MSGQRRRSGVRATPAPILVGPASPRDLADLMTGRDRALAEAIPGYRGVPVSELARALIDAGIDVEVATTATEVDVPVTLEGKGLRLHVAPMRARARHRALDAFRREREWLLRSIEASDANVVHAHWTYEYAWAALDSGRPVVVTAHDAPLTVLRHFRDRYRAIRTAMAYLVRLSIPTLTAVSPYLARRWRREMGYRKPITVIPNIAPALPTAPPRPLANRAPRMLEVGNPERIKNVGSLVHAFRLLRETYPEIELDLVGPGLAEGDALPAALAREGSCHGIRFLGVLDRDALAATLDEARALVHPSVSECCPMVVLEAMRAGVPVVAGRKAGGTPWMLEHGRAGILVDVRDPTALARGVATLLEDDALARGYAERARLRADKCFSPKVVSSAYLDEYERVLAGPA
jgi:L-malate glycosyltransferase